MDLAFIHSGFRGEVHVEIEAMRDPTAVGKPLGTEGFPSCLATVEYPGEGYHALFGWVQLVRSQDNVSGGAVFELDPFGLFEDTPTPYAFFGFRPVLFDAPSRDERKPLNWVSHSFLAVTPLYAEERQVVPLLGFSWGFDIDDDETITISASSQLSPADWRQHVDYLSQLFPTWKIREWPS